MADDQFNEQPIVFSNVPLLQELCHVVVSIDSKEVKDSSVKSDFQWQLLKTRILIFSDFNVMASPMLGELRFIHVVCYQEYYNSGCLNLLLEKNRLKIETVSKLTLEIFEACLLYNLITKLAPAWNRVEKLFIEGRYFLMKRGQLSAIELNCLISDDKLLLYVCPLRLWLREVDLLDFDLPVSVLKNLVSEKFYKDLSHEPQWVHVLPSFKRGRIVYVTNRIPEKCTFTDYQQMRRHWKNTYGFRLPEECSSMIYVGINFFGPLDYTYPLVCVRRGLHYNIGDPKLILDFASAVSSRASIICGKTLKLINLGVPLQPYFMAGSICKWEEKNLLSMEKHVLDNFLSKPNELELTMNSQISLSNQSQSNFDPNKPTSQGSYDDWFIKCSNFIEGLSQVELKRSRLRATSKPLFLKKPRHLMKGSIKSPVFIKENESIEKREDKIPLQENHDLPTNSIISVEGTEPSVSVEVKQDVKIPHKPVFKKPKNVKAHSSKQLIESPTLNSSAKVKPVIPKNLCATDNNGILKPVFKKIKQPLVKTPVTNTSLVKKPSERKKHATFTESEIEELNRAGKLNKVNAPSLLIYLRKKGIQCKSSDKKPSLLAQVQLLLSELPSK